MPSQKVPVWKHAHLHEIALVWTTMCLFCFLRFPVDNMHADARSAESARFTGERAKF